MQIVLNVDGDVFSDLINKEIQDYPKEKIQEIIHDGLIKAMEEVGPKLFITKEQNSIYGCYSKDVPTDAVLTAAKNFDLSPKFKEIEQKMLNKMDEDCEKILVKVLGDLVCRTVCNSNDFTNRIMSSITSMNNNGGN